MGRAGLGACQGRLLATRLAPAPPIGVITCPTIDPLMHAQPGSNILSRAGAGFASWVPKASITVPRSFLSPTPGTLLALWRSSDRQVQGKVFQWAHLAICLWSRARHTRDDDGVLFASEGLVLPPFRLKHFLPNIANRCAALQ